MKEGCNRRPRDRNPFWGLLSKIPVGVSIYIIYGGYCVGICSRFMKDSSNPSYVEVVSFHWKKYIFKDLFTEDLLGVFKSVSIKKTFLKCLYRNLFKGFI